MTINKLLTNNCWQGRNGYSVEWIVLHYTANTHQPDLAYNEASYNASTYIAGSAHYFVDDTSIWQSVLDENTAWGVGDAPSRNGCINYNSINIEMCNVYQNGVYSISDATVNNTVWLVEELLKKYPTAKLCRHYDVTGKYCPQPWVTNPKLWTNFLKQVEENKPMTDAEKKAFKALQDEVATLKKANAQLQVMIETLGRVDSRIDKRVSSVESHTLPKYHKIDDAPNWLKPTLKKLVSKGYLKGTDKDDLAISYDEARLLTINDRAGDYDL